MLLTLAQSLPSKVEQFQRISSELKREIITYKERKGEIIIICLVVRVSAVCYFYFVTL